MKIINTSLYPDSLPKNEFDNYLAKGWYRMTQNIFSVTHWFNYETIEVDRVWWLRYHIQNIQSHRSHRKIRKMNAEFDVEYEKYDEIPEEDHLLYDRYYEWIQFDGYISLDRCLYGEKENKKIFNSWSISVLDQGKVIAKGIIDLGEKAIMAKVNFFDPDYAKYSPGKFIMLKSIDFLREKEFKWYYPGYVIVNRPKFDYKLFIGKESAEYYDPEIEKWKPYDDAILRPEILTEDEKSLLEDVYFRFWR
jgi:arginyl-tRNA--protein-N-Asp/Glu arginylyltransferase